MRILHTADWHVGKRLGRYDRMDEHADVLAEVAEIADAEAADMVVVAGDLFDRSHAPIEALRLALDALDRLARGGAGTAARPVVAIAGNHDSPELFELLAPLLRSRGVRLVGEIKRPGAGGVIELAAGGGRALVACFPFLREGRVVEFMKESDQWHGAYAERVGKLCAAYDEYLGEKGAGAVKVLTAHFTVHGVKVGGHGLPRGERALHLGEAYTATEQAIPPGPQYVAMGHVHAPQPVPGAAVPAAYAGSLLELDFGEAGEEKRVVLVEAEPGVRATVRSIPMSRGRRLRRVRGRWEELAGRDDLRDVYLDLTVETDGPDPGLADRAQQAFPYLVKVRTDYERVGQEAPVRTDQPWDELYRGYCRSVHGTEPSAELLQAFREVYAEVIDA